MSASGRHASKCDNSRREIVMFVPRVSKAVPPQERSDYITECTFDIRRYHQGNGDMWPLTWGLDGNMYGGAGDNRLSPMNFWRIRGEPEPRNASHQNDWFVDLIDNFPLDPVTYCREDDVDPFMGIKPAGLLDVNGLLYFAVEFQNYGWDEGFKRQENVRGHIITSWDYGKTWNHDATPLDFFSGRLSSCHFVQYGPGYRGAPDAYVYAYFPVADDGRSYWENGDAMILGRVPRHHIIDRKYWEFYIGDTDAGEHKWSSDDAGAKEVFRYPCMCGENHVSYNAGIGRYLLGNYSFVDDNLTPRPNHQGTWPESAYRSQLTLYESKTLFGPWKLFYQDDNWGTYGDYQPSFPPKWMYDAGKLLYMVSSGTYDDYNFTVQKCRLTLDESKR